MEIRTLQRLHEQKARSRGSYSLGDGTGPVLTVSASKQCTASSAVSARCAGGGSVHLPASFVRDEAIVSTGLGHFFLLIVTSRQAIWHQPGKVGERGGEGRVSPQIGLLC